jgi:thiosulfate/3-mercaptopyruvate sulfurtransferase
VHSDRIETSELAPHLGDPDWAILDCRFYLAEPERGENEYLAEHVQGALYVHLDRDLSGPRTGRNGRHPMPSVDAMAKRFSSWGIDGNVQVVAYDSSQGQMAARLWWMLRYLDHNAVAVLDGGFPAWKAEARPVARERENRASRTFRAAVRESMRVDVGDIDLARNFLIDARASERFRGDVEPLDPVKGHIPGARNHPNAENLGVDGRFLSKQELRQRFDSLIGERPVQSIVSYCGSGVTACHNLLAMEIAGIHGARLYPGSWSEWCADETRPVATGDAG